MTQRSKITIWIASGILLGCISAGVIWILPVIFQESLYMKEGSLEYRLTISSKTIKSFPRVGRTSEVTFYSSCGDGPKPPAQGLSYVTDVNPVEVNRVVDAFLRSDGFRLVRVSSDSPSNYEKDSTTAQLFVSRGNNGRTEVQFVEDYLQ